MTWCTADQNVCGAQECAQMRRFHQPVLSRSVRKIPGSHNFFVLRDATRAVFLGRSAAVPGPFWLVRWNPNHTHLVPRSSCHNMPKHTLRRKTIRAIAVLPGLGAESRWVRWEYVKEGRGPSVCSLELDEESRGPSAKPCREKSVGFIEMRHEHRGTGRVERRPAPRVHREDMQEIEKISCRLDMEKWCRYMRPRR